MSNYTNRETKVINGLSYTRTPDLSLAGALNSCVFAGVTAHGNGTELSFLRLGQGRNQHVSLLINGKDEFWVSERE